MKLNFDKSNGLIPAIIQDHITNKVLMLGYMNETAFRQTKKEGIVTFYSRSKKRLWTKGETSGNYLTVKNIISDCDSDTLLIKVKPAGPVCHKGTDTCFNEKNSQQENFIECLEQVIRDRKENPTENSYTAKLFALGVNRIAQKVGEEAVEVLIEAVDDKSTNFKNEAADLLFHYLVLLAEKNISFDDIVEVLRQRHK
jgi:phosphoribosyl-ATP pyrophosphohydrolase/phosphoribosyl-AMP cyclohydrolase